MQTGVQPLSIAVPVLMMEAAHMLMVLGSVQDPRIQRLPCTHSGTYADDCLCERVQQHKCYIVATCDRDLRRRIRKARPLAYCVLLL